MKFLLATLSRVAGLILANSFSYRRIYSAYFSKLPTTSEPTVKSEGYFSMRPTHPSRSFKRGFSIWLYITLLGCGSVFCLSHFNGTSIVKSILA